MTTAAGRGAVPERHELSMGLVGLYATPPLDRIPAESDVVLAVGTRLEETVRLGWPEAERVRLIHIDVDPHTFGQVIEPEVAIAADAVLALRGLSAALETVVPNATWRERAARADAEASRRSLGPSLVRDAMLAAGDVFGEHATYVHENGLHDIWSYHYPLLPVGDATRVVVPGEQTMLGFGLPAAVGAAMARPETPTLLLCGDGALGMNLPALATAAEQRAGLAVVMFDNEGFGWPRHLRAIEGRPDEITRFSVPFPIADVVRGLGGTVAVARRAEDLRPAIEQARSAALGGGIGLVRVPVRDDDVPPGIARVLADEN